MKPRKLRKRHSPAGKLAIRALASLLICVVIILSVDIDFTSIRYHISNAKPLWLLLAAAGFPALMALKGLRWHLLIRNCGLYFPISACISSYFGGFALGVITPGRLGELARGWRLKVELDASPETSLRTVVSDRAFDLLFLVFAGIAGAPFLLSDFARLKSTHYPQLALGALLLLATGYIVYLRLLRPRYSKLASLERFVRNVVGDCFSKMSFWPWVVTSVSYLIYFGCCYFLLIAVHLKIPFLPFCFILSLMSLILLLPISIAGFGTRETILIYMLGNYGVSAEGALTYSLFHFTFFFVYGGLLGAVFLMVSPMSLKLDQPPHQTDALLVSGESEGAQGPLDR